MRRSPAGILVAAPDRNWVALRLDMSRFQEDDDTWDNPYRSALHDYVHLVLRLNYVQLPAWLEEGLAEFWGNTIVDGDRVILGRVVPSHQWTLRERTFMPLAKLFAITTVLRSTPRRTVPRRSMRRPGRSCTSSPSAKARQGSSAG